LDNYCSHKRNELWLAAHPNVFFHSLPHPQLAKPSGDMVWNHDTKSIARSKLQKHRGVGQGINDFVTAYGPTAKPFIWRKREIKGSQLKNTIANLRN